MSTVDKEFAENIARNGGWHNTYGDNPRVVLIVEYDNAWGGQGYGLVFEGKPNRYTETEYVQRPRAFWSAE